MAVLHDLVAALCTAGVGSGDLLYVASDITLPLAEARKNKGVQTREQRETFLGDIVDTLQQVVGEKGTLLFPVFTWAFCRGEGFDIRRTPGEVGVFSNWIMKNRREFQRTRHPIYSFMVWGRAAGQLASLTNTDSWGCDSPFAYLHEHEGKMLLLSVSLRRGFTFMHYVGESIRVPYRYRKDFRGSYTDMDGKTTERVYSMYVRDMTIKSEEYEPDEWLDEAGVTCVSQWGRSILRIVDLPKAYEIVKDDLLHGGGRYCYKFTNYKIDWQSGPTHADELLDG